MRPLVVAAVAALLACGVARAADPLPSWNDRAPKKAIVELVGKVTKAGSPEFVPPAERIATFDNDGTLWAEQPMYFQFLFALDRVKAVAPQHPEWQTKEPFSLGANLAGIAPAIQAKQWSAIEAVVAKFQATAMRMRTSLVPTVCAVRGMALGGSCEFILHADRTVAAPRDGFQEAIVSATPRGGGTVTLFFRRA